MKYKLSVLAIMLITGNAIACNNQVDCTASAQEVIDVINTKMQPIQPTDKFSKWGDSYRVWFDRVNDVAERRLGIKFNSFGDLARWEISQSTTTSGNSTDNNTSNDAGGESTSQYITPAQAQEGDNAAFARARGYSDAVSDHAEAAAEGYADNAAAKAEDNAKKYTETVGGEVLSMADYAIADSAQKAHDYTDQKVKAAEETSLAAAAAAEKHIDSVAGDTLEAAKKYTGEVAAQTKDEASRHADDVAAKAEVNANKHADQVAHTESVKAESSANKHADKVARVEAEKAESSANQYTNRSVAATLHYADRNLAESKSYTDHVAKGLKKQIDHNASAIKRLGASSQATANLHYNANHNGYAISVGAYDGETALAGGLQFQTGKHTALTVQTSYDAEALGGSVGLHGDW